MFSTASDTEDPFSALIGPTEPVAELIGEEHPEQSAKGHGTVEILGDGGILKYGYSFSFTALRTDDAKGSVKAMGQFEYHPAETTEVKIHGEVICLTVLKPGIAVIGGVVTHSNSKALPAGAEVYFSASDNGEGLSNQIDMLSQPIPSPAKHVVDVCLKPPKLLEFPIKDGNIQVPWDDGTK